MSCSPVSGLGASGLILSVWALACLHSLHPFRVVLIEVTNTQRYESVVSGAPEKESINFDVPGKTCIHSTVPNNILISNTGLASSI